jgi:hypothetical protein
VIPVALLAAGILVAIFQRDGESRQRRIDLVFLAGLVWCALGNIPGPSAFGLLHELPIYTSLRVPSRFLGPAMVGFALVVTSAFMAARARLAELGVRPQLRRAFAIAQILLVAAIAVDVCVTNQARLQQGMDPPLARDRASADFYQAATDYGRFPTHPVRGIGTRQCYVPLEWKPAPGIVDGKVPQQWIEPATAGQIVPLRWTPNRLEMAVNLKAPGVVIINQNYESGWQIVAGPTTAEIGAYLTGTHHQWPRSSGVVGETPTPPVGLLSVAMPAGHNRLELRHRPPALAGGVVLMILGVGLAIAALRWLTPARIARWRAAIVAYLSQPGSHLSQPR